MDGNLVCCICGEVSKDPKQLPCSHICCRLCLQRYCLEHTESGTFLCPSCGKPLPALDSSTPLLDWVDSFPTDIAITKKIGHMQWIYGATVKEKCVSCLLKSRAVIATKYCKACHEYFCDECGNQHWLLRPSRFHRVMLIDDLESLKNDPLLRADLAAIFSAKIKPRSKSLKNGMRSSRSNSPRSGLLSPRNNFPMNGLRFPRSISRENSPTPPRGKSPFGNLLSPYASKSIEQFVDVDLEESKIVDMTFLSNGCVALSDESNRKIKLFDKNYRLLSSTEAYCWNLVTLDKYLIAGSCPNERSVQYFSVNNNIIKIDGSADLEQPCYGLCRADNKLAVACSGFTVRIKFLNIDKRVIPETVDVQNGKKILKTPHSLCYNSQKNTFYLSDSDAKCVKCLTGEGKILWERFFPDGKCLKMYGSHILLARSDQHTVDLLDSNGRCLKSVVCTQDGLARVTALAVDSHGAEDGGDARLMVTDETDLVRVSSLLDPNKELQTLFGHSHNDPKIISNHAKSKVRNSKLCVIL